MTSAPMPVPGIDDGPCGEGLGIDGDLGWALGMVFRAYVKKTGAALADVPGGPRGYQVLASSTRGTPCTQAALAQHLGVDRTVMTYLLDDLVRAGLIERQPDPADRRARRVVTTDAGRARLAELDEALCDAEAQVLAALTTGERGTLRELLRRVALHEDGAGRSLCEVAEEMGGAEPSIVPQRGKRREGSSRVP